MLFVFSSWSCQEMLCSHCSEQNLSCSLTEDGRLRELESKGPECTAVVSNGWEILSSNNLQLTDRCCLTTFSCHCDQIPSRNLVCFGSQLQGVPLFSMAGEGWSFTVAGTCSVLFTAGKPGNWGRLGLEVGLDYKPPYPRWLPSPARLYLLKLSPPLQQHHPLGTKCSNTGVCERNFTRKQQLACISIENSHGVFASYFLSMQAWSWDQLPH